ncbi:MAG TPA: hypothetical protein VFS83_09445 [Ktedonobacterales bacterium]|nr:hypothetical protein [Ktedonobacterales bacterium]
MDQAKEATSPGIEPRQPKRCPLCGATVAPDALGLYECVCGWGGPGDPLEHDHGLAKLMAKMDRSLADEQAWRDLRRLAARGDATSSLSILYLGALLLAATAIYLAVLAIIALCVWLIISTALDHTWIGAIVGGILLALIVGSLWPQRHRDWRHPGDARTLPSAHGGAGRSESADRCACAKACCVTTRCCL